MVSDSCRRCLEPVSLEVGRSLEFDLPFELLRTSDRSCKLDLPFELARTSEGTSEASGRLDLPFELDLSSEGLLELVRNLSFELLFTRERSGPGSAATAAPAFAAAAAAASGSCSAETRLPVFLNFGLPSPTFFSEGGSSMGKANFSMSIVSIAFNIPGDLFFVGVFSWLWLAWIRTTRRYMSSQISLARLVVPPWTVFP